MKPENLLDYIQLGGILGQLRATEAGVRAHGEGGVLDGLNRILEFIDSSDFKVTKEGIFILDKYKKYLDKTPEDHALTQQEQNKLFDIMKELMFLIYSESKTIFAFFLTEKRLDSEKLLNVASLYSLNVYNSLPDSIQYDFTESGKCIAFECSTAGAFHVLRGLEGLLRLLLGKLDPSVDTSTMVWGTVISNLRNLNISELSILLDNCDRIRDNYRNPTNHPEKIYNIEEVQDLFNLCVGIVNDIVAYMKLNNLL